MNPVLVCSEVLSENSSVTNLIYLSFSTAIIVPRLFEKSLYPQKFALTTPPSGGRSVGIVRSRGSGHVVFLYCSILLH
jgi:hypothetical protein